MVCTRTLDTSCCPEWAEFDPAEQEMATEMAWETLRSLSGYRIGNCPVTLRPCSAGCGAPGTYQVWPAGPGGGFMTPTVVDGAWFNACGCTGDNCSCTFVCEIRLPGEVASIEEVTQDGVALDSEAYRVDNGNLLVRLDDACWPICQNMNLALTEVNTLGVTFTPGVMLTPWMSRAAGALACEYAKACGSRSAGCRLPPNVTRIVRQGVSLDLAANPFPGGMTGLREVDVLTARYNPNRLQAPSVVYSPDLRRGRVTTWP